MKTILLEGEEEVVGVRSLLRLVRLWMSSRGLEIQRVEPDCNTRLWMRNRLQSFVVPSSRRDSLPLMLSADSLMYTFVARWTPVMVSGFVK